MDPVQQAEYWSARYQQGQTAWDLGEATPVLRQLLREAQFPVKVPAPVLVPGCGYGHDVLLLAEVGYRVTAVDFAPEPLQRLAAYAHQRGLSERMLLLQADIWSLPEALEGTFAAVWEYTCFCAIDPRRRGAYFALMRRLLRPGGYLVGLFFPLEGGGKEAPPFAVHQTEVETLAAQAGFQLQSAAWPEASHPARRGREILMVFIARA